MNKAEYQDYESHVRAFFKTEGINCLSVDGEEGDFSIHKCDCCGTTLGGARYDARGYSPQMGEIYEYSICSDCLYYVEYGRLDDMTMMEIDVD